MPRKNATSLAAAVIAKTLDHHARRTRKGARSFDLVPKDGEAKVLSIGDMLAKALREIDRAGREAARAKRRLMRARMKYGVLKRLNDQKLEQSLQVQA